MDVLANENETNIAPSNPIVSYTPGMGHRKKRNMTSIQVKSIIAMTDNDAIQLKNNTNGKIWFEIFDFIFNSLIQVYNRIMGNCNPKNMNVR
jgi:hypothetical protein